MAYGAVAKRAPAISGGNVADVDIYKIGLMCKCERGLTGIKREIFSMNDFIKNCGGFGSGTYGPYVAKSFYDTLDRSVNVEMKVLMHVADDAVQASGEIMDGASTAVRIFDIKAAQKGKDDLSEFGNKIAYRILQSEKITFRLTANATSSTNPVSIFLNTVDHLEIGYHIKVVEGTNSEVAVITDIDRANKTVTFAALANSYSQTNTTVSRLDWNLYIAVEDNRGVYQLQEEWLDQPFAKSDSLGMPKAVNDPVSGSYYVKLEVNDGNSSAPGEQLPADVTAWESLSGGSDGATSPGAGDWNSLVNSFADEDVMIFLAPEDMSDAHNKNMAVFATSGYKWIYYGQGENLAGTDSLKNLGASLREPVIFGMIPCDKWLETYDPENSGNKISIPPTGALAAHWFNNYSLYGPGKVAAGNRDTLRTSDRLIDDNGLVHNDSNGVGGMMIRNYSINLAQFRRGKGITVNSARTLSTDDGYKFQNQVMLWLLIKKSILTYLQSIEQDPAGVNAQESHYNAVWSYMKKKYDAGVFFQGQKEDGTFTSFEDVVIIINDFSINTLANINNGIEETFLQFIAAPPIEEPILSLASAGVTTVRS